MASGDSLLPNRPLLQELFAAGVYKRNQGRMVRQVTCLAIWLVVAVAAALPCLVLAPAAGWLGRLFGGRRAGCYRYLVWLSPGQLAAVRGFFDFGRS